MSRGQFDPVSLEVMWSRLINITEECWITIWRTAFSTIIGEAQDFGCELLDVNGESLAHSPRSMPVFNLTLPRAAKSLLEVFPRETLQDGDVLVTNDPWICAGHLFDVAVVTPVFRRGKLVAIVGSIAHCSDIGGTRDYMKVREVYEEGLQLPPMKLYRAGEPNHDLIAIIRQNVRKGDMVMGDIHAQYSANRVAMNRLVTFMDEYGLESLTELAHEVQTRAEDAMRVAIEAVPDGTYGSSVRFDGVDHPLELAVEITVDGTRLRTAWEGPPQLPVGGINCTMNYTAAHSVYALKSILTPDIPSNAGCFRPVEVTAPDGSILNCHYPAGVNMRTHTGWYCAPAIFKALAPALPNQVQAFTGLPMGAGAYGREKGKPYFNDHLFQGGGQGASTHGDGKNALLYPTSAANTSIEMFETRVPLLVEEKSLIPDSGGPGKYRGGLGQRIQVRKLHDDGEPVLLSLHPQGMLVSTEGLFNGQAGRRAKVAVTTRQGSLENQDVGSMAELRTTEDVCTIEMPGGSGYGNPHERDVAALQRDREDGYVTSEGADQFYSTARSESATAHTSDGG